MRVYNAKGVLLPKGFSKPVITLMVSQAAAKLKNQRTRSEPAQAKTPSFHTIMTVLSGMRFDIVASFALLPATLPLSPLLLLVSFLF